MSNNAPPDLIPLLMTRPRAPAEAFVASLPDDILAQVAPIYSPLITIQPLGVERRLRPGEAAIFTSANGVLHGPAGEGTPAFCVGAATTIAAADAGWDAEMRGQTADALVGDILQNPPNQRLIHLSGTHTRGDIAGRLSAHGLSAENVAVYDQIAQSLTTQARTVVEGGKPALVPLFSPRTAAQFAIEVPRAISMHIIALSSAVANALDRQSYASVTVAEAPDAKAMRKALAAVLSDLASG